MNKAPAGWFTVKELHPGVFGIGEFGHFEEVLSFLLVGVEQALLIDTGLGFFSMKALVESITDLPCSVINTHSHFDHIGSNAEFANVAMFEHELSRKYAMAGVPSGRLAKWITDEQFTVPRPPLPDPYLIQPFPYANYFQVGSLISCAPFSLEVLYTPGHSDDSVSFYDRTLGVLFPGDLIYDGPIFVEPEGGWQKYQRSIAQLAALPNLKRIFPSHNSFELSLRHFDMVAKLTREIQTVELEETIVVEGRLKLVPR